MQPPGQAIINANVSNSGGRVVTRNSGPCPCPCCQDGCGRAQEPVPINGINSANVERPLLIEQPNIPLPVPSVPLPAPAVPLPAPAVPLPAPAVTLPAPAIPRTGAVSFNSPEPVVPLSETLPQQNSPEFPYTGK